MSGSDETTNQRRTEQGFTLIEVLIVTTIIGILVSIVLVSLLNAFERSKQRATMADMRTISKAIETYSTDTGHYPASGQTMTQLANLLVPYQTSVLPVQDAWRHDYSYTADNNGNYSLESYGKDGVDGPEINYANRFNFDLDIIVSDGTFTASPEP